MKELKDLVVGDDVLVTVMSYRHIAKVDKVTKTQIIVNNAIFLVQKRVDITIYSIFVV